MFWVHDKFGNGFDDPDGPSWPTQLPNQIDLTRRPRRAGPVEKPKQVRSTRWSKQAWRTIPASHACQVHQPGSARPDLTRPVWVIVQLGPTRSSNRLNPSGLSSPFVSSGTLDKIVSIGLLDLARSSNSFRSLGRLGLTRSSGRLGLSGQRVDQVVGPA